MTTNRREGPSREAVEVALRGLDRADLAAARWYGDKGRAIEDVDARRGLRPRRRRPPARPRDRRGSGAAATGSAGPVPGGTDRGPAATGRPGDGTWRALAAAMADGRTIAALPRPTPTGDARRPGARRRSSAGRAGRCHLASRRATERDLGADQSNTSVVLGETVLVKAYRRVQPGLNPELELVAYLSEQAGFPAVPPLAGYAEVVSARDGVATVAIAQAFVADGADAYESIAEALTAWLLAPGRGERRVRDRGRRRPRHARRPGMHAALASARDVPGFEPRRGDPRRPAALGRRRPRAARSGPRGHRRRRRARCSATSRRASPRSSRPSTRSRACRS